MLVCLNVYRSQAFHKHKGLQATKDMQIAASCSAQYVQSTLVQYPTLARQSASSCHVINRSHASALCTLLHLTAKFLTCLQSLPRPKKVCKGKHTSIISMISNGMAPALAKNLYSCDRFSGKLITCCAYQLGLKICIVTQDKAVQAPVMIHCFSKA